MSQAKRQAVADPNNASISTALAASVANDRAGKSMRGRCLAGVQQDIEHRTRAMRFPPLPRAQQFPLLNSAPKPRPMCRNVSTISAGAPLKGFPDEPRNTILPARSQQLILSDDLSSISSTQKNARNGIVGFRKQAGRSIRERPSMN